MDPFRHFTPMTSAWFRTALGSPTRIQREGWAHIARGAADGVDGAYGAHRDGVGAHALLCAPTGSGKTLAAFLACLDRLLFSPGERAGVKVLYISPQKALAYDVERNVRRPLEGLAAEAARAGVTAAPIEVSVRTGDTPPRQRQRFLARPGQILITTPESLYLLLGTQARRHLTSIETIIVDEIHALAGNKRGAHLSLSLERLCAITARDPQRIGLSATLRPLEVVAEFLGGDRPVAIVDAGEPPALDLTVEPMVKRPRRDQASVTKSSTKEVRRTEAMETGLGPRIFEWMRGRRTTLVFCNSRRLCERLASELNELFGAPQVRAHHGSLSRQKREEVEGLLKAGLLSGLVATSSLELGIDMGSIDLVVQVESPGAVDRGLQRIGRAGHGVGQRSTGRLVPRHEADLLEAAAVASGMLEGDVEPLSVPRHPLDVLSQQIVAMAAVEETSVARLEELVRRAAPYKRLPREHLVGVLEMLGGRYPSGAFADLRPRISLNRAAGTFVGRKEARLIVFANPGTIPDRGLFAVHLGEGGPRVGELDEEMVHESRIGEVFLLGASSWRIVDIGRDRVTVEPAPGEPGRMPFWRGEGPGRPLGLGRRLGRLVDRLMSVPREEAAALLATECHLELEAAAQLLDHLAAQQAATGVVPSARRLVVERFHDELGDYRVCLLSPLGARVHAPLALALRARLAALHGSAGAAPEVLHSDEGIVLRFSTGETPPGAALFRFRPDEVEPLILEELRHSSLFAAHFRECAARALLLPRRRVGVRAPLFSQRLRAQALLGAASSHPDFPIVLETYRECLHDVFDLPALRTLLSALEEGAVQLIEVETRSPSPFARALVFEYVASYLYAGDAPLGERRAQALQLDRHLLDELLDPAEQRQLIDPAVLAELEQEVSGTAEERRVRSADELTDLLGRIGDLDSEELSARVEGDPRPLIENLLAAGRVAEVSVAGQERLVAIEDVSDYHNAGVAASFDRLLLRFARGRGPFSAAAAAARFGVSVEETARALERLATAAELQAGALRPGGEARDFCDPQNLRRLRRRTLERLRHRVAPVSPANFARFLPAWQGVGRELGGLDGLRAALPALEGLALPIDEWESSILPMRVPGFEPHLLDQWSATGEIVWVGEADDRVALYRRDRAPLLLGEPLPRALSPLGATVLEGLRARGALFYAQLRAFAAEPPDRDLFEALGELVFAGLVTNDTVAPLRYLGAKRRGRPGPAAVGGRWALVDELRTRPVGPEERLRTRVDLLLDRYGVLGREAVHAEGIRGGFGALAPLLSAMEDAGRLRRGYFVEGLGGAQYARPETVERLRATCSAQLVTLSALDPANIYGSIVEWPEPLEPGPLRLVAGAKVVLEDGVPIGYLDSSGHALRTFEVTSARLESLVAALRTLARGRRDGTLHIEKIDGTPALRSALLRPLSALGGHLEPNAWVVDQ